MIDEVAATYIRYIDALQRQGHTMKAIAATLNASHPRDDGRMWTSAAIDRVLYNLHLYRGSRRGKQVETWPVILEPLAD